MMRLTRVLFLLAAALLLLASCAPGPSGLVGTADESGKTAGFWQGLWHGFIAPFSFLVSLFSRTVNVYEVHNSGGWYNFGYVLGLSCIFGGGGHGSGRVRRKRRRFD